MKLPLSLIRSHLPLGEKSLAEIAEALTLLGIEVEKIDGETPPFQGVIAADVEEVIPHPQAEKLRIATVFDGKARHQIVCGAPNCRAGIKTAFAPIGTVLHSAQSGKSLTIGRAKIRGVESAGMLCSGEELSVSSDGDGILELPLEIEAGRDLLPLLWNPVFEISITPNLGHCLSALGIARELSAFFQIPLHKAPPPSIREGKAPLSVSIEDPEGCPLYSCCLIENVTVAPSPFWLQRELELAGHSSISNVVDALNWILLKWGQPLHAFDADTLDLTKMRVAKSRKTENVPCLDGKTREATPGTLLIWSGDEPAAIAGIMGGMKSSVTSKTKRILIESALFDPQWIRAAAKKMALRTESSYRFERGIDAEGVEPSLRRAVALILDLAGGTPSPLGICGAPPKRRSIQCRAPRAEAILGRHFSLSEMGELFERLGCPSRPKGGEALEVDIPSYRLDLNEEIDLIEELARLYGYNNLERSPPRYQTAPLPPNPEYTFDQKTRRALLRLGLQEVLHCDLIGPRLSEISRQIAPKEVAPISTLYSKSEEHSTLRTTLLPSLLETVARNFAQKNRSLALFELGRIHFLQQGKTVELPMGAILLTGPAAPSHWSTPRSSEDRKFDFFDLKGKIEELLSLLHLRGYHFSRSHHAAFHPSRQAFLSFGDLRVGSFGEVHPTLLEAFDISEKVFFAEIDLAPLRDLAAKELFMKPLPQYPSSERDWTLPLSPHHSIEKLLEKLSALAPPILEKVEVIDLYQKEESHERHLTLRFTYRDLSKTLSFEQVEAEHARLIQEVQ